MTTFRLSIVTFTRAVIGAWVLVWVLAWLSTAALAQPAGQHRFLNVAYIKSHAERFAENEIRFWLPVHQRLVDDGKKKAWLLYRVKYPGGTSAKYDYVSFDLLEDWQQVESPNAELGTAIDTVHPRTNAKKMSEQRKDSGEIVWTQLFELLGQADSQTSTPARFVVVNEMKVLPGVQARYLELELNYFMPFHALRAQRGVMNNWWLYRASMPYGEKYESDYVTFNGFDNWGDIRKNNPPDIWKTVHGEVEFNKVHDEILGLRATVNNELWELIAHTR